MAERENRGFTSLMDTGVPSQLDEDDLRAEVEIELPDSQNNVMAMIDAENVDNIEITSDDDGGVTVDFEPSDGRGEGDDFYMNLAEEMPDRELGRISSDLLGEYDSNKASRQEWEDTYSNGLELLGFTHSERTEPFRGASGVTHPLLAEAATQFQAQAFNELLPPSGPVKTQVMGQETVEKVAQSQRVKQFMNYYITNVMEDYTPDMDQMLFYLPLAGSTFKKVYYDETLCRAVSKFVPAENLVVPYETSDLDTCPNITQVIRMSLNDLRKKQVSGFYLDKDDLRAEVEIELPDSQNNVMAMIDAENVDNIEITSDDDGGVTVDFEPSDGRGEGDDFYMNLAEEMPDRELGRISSDLLGEYDSNKASRQEWEDTYSNGLELLGFTHSERTEPFRGASGVTHPLLAEAATQFQAQAFNELLPPSGPVKTQVMGQETVEKVAQSQRVKQFMNYYITNVMEDYTPDMDQMLFYLPLAGSTFKKVYYDETLCRAVSKFVPAENLVVPYETSDLDTCPNITQVIRMSLNDLRKKQVSGFYLDKDVIPSQSSLNDITEETNKIEGFEPSDVDYDCTILECHVDLDLEGYEDKDENGEETGLRFLMLSQYRKITGRF